MVEQTSVTIDTADGYPLAGTLYRGAEPRVAILISAGTGFPQRTYRHVAAFLAARGAVVLTYDYRGVAGSRRGDLAQSEIDYPDWGRLDMPAAVETLHKQAGGLPMTLLAHSVGGHFLGLMPNQHLLQKHAFVAVGAGYWRQHHLSYVPKEIYFWWLLGNYCLLRYGHLAPVGGWTGESLPPKLFKTWRRWCHTPGFFAPDLEGFLAPQHYDQVTAPIRSWIFEDDPIATPASGAQLLSVYPSAQTDIRVAAPTEYGVKRIGHDAAFRQGCEGLWREIWEWLAE